MEELTRRDIKNMTKREVVERSRLNWGPELFQEINNARLSKREKLIALKRNINAIESLTMRHYDIFTNNAAFDLYRIVFRTFKFYLNVIKAPFVLADKIDNYMRNEFSKDIMLDLSAMMQVESRELNKYRDLEKRVFRSS